jgi:hypothetical protein
MELGVTQMQDRPKSILKKTVSFADNKMGRGSQYNGTSRSHGQSSHGRPGRNPEGKACYLCGSTNHLAAQCPKKGKGQQRLNKISVEESDSEGA